MSMHIKAITEDPILGHRARMILVGLAGVFMRCSLALMGGLGAPGLAIALFLGCLTVIVIGVWSYAPVAKTPAPHGASLVRTLGSNACYGVEILGAVLLFAGQPWGLNVAAIAMVANFFFVISGCWLLMLGIRRDEVSQT
jgi:hypothetical protein